MSNISATYTTLQAKKGENRAPAIDESCAEVHIANCLLICSRERQQHHDEQAL